MYPKLIAKRFAIGSLVTLWHFASILTAQQQYSEETTFDCDNTDKTGPSPAFLYTCNGQNHFCQAYLIFRSLPLYASATTISNLTSSALLELSRINNISKSEVLPLNSEVIVPVNCSCSGMYYQAGASYTIQTEQETYFTIANNTYEGLATCNALMRENPYGATELQAGFKLRVPLRCACPTKNQTSQGVKFLLTYLVTWNDNIPNLSKRFNVPAGSVANANDFSEEDPTLYPFTTILIPLPDEPLSSRPKVYSPPIAPPLPPPPPLPSLSDQRHKESRKGLYIGIAIGSSVGVISCVLFLLLRHCKGGKINKALQKNKQRKEMQNLTENIKQKISRFDKELKIYRFDELEAATEGFSARKKLSDSVYHGVLRGKLVAIKKMSRNVKKEVKILQKINHFNLISLYGVSTHNGVYYLAHEFMENGSLKQWLNQKDNPENQSWNIRIRMALDIANGLDYLHNFTTPGYVHKDITSSNILVNADLRAKIANLSFAKSPRTEEIGNSLCSSSASFVLGTKGYMAPEYLEAGNVTPKIDVYAFGVVLLELITGRDAVFMENGQDFLLSEAAISVMSAPNAEAAVGRLMDSSLQEKHPLGYIIDQSQLALRILELSVACLSIDPAKRPTVAAVISSLLKIQLDVKKSDYSFSVE